MYKYNKHLITFVWYFHVVNKQSLYIILFHNFWAIVNFFGTFLAMTIRVFITYPQLGNSGNAVLNFRSLGDMHLETSALPVVPKNVWRDV